MLRMLRIHNEIESSAVNGPGNRAVIWFQGCTLSCGGCWNPETWDPAMGRLRSIDTMLDWLALCEADYKITGVTFSGGEPMQQAAGLFALIIRIRQEFPGLSLGMFSGYSEQELDRGAFRCDPEIGNRYPEIGNRFPEAKKGIWAGIRSQLDFAVLGRYNAQAPAGEALTTSTNQKLRLFTSRYQASDFHEQSIEIQIDDTGLTQITGFPTRGF